MNEEKSADRDSLMSDLRIARDEYGSDASREAYGRVIQAFRYSLHAQAMALLKDPDRADELVQRVTITSWLKLRSLNNVEAFAGWIHTIIRRSAFTFQQRDTIGRLIDLDAVSPPMAPHQEGQESERLSHAEQRELLKMCMSTLREMDRRTLEEFYLQGNSILEVCRILDLPEGTVKRRLHYARHRLRRLMEKKGLTAEFL